MSAQGKPWFRRRRFGWGWSPATKEGWGVLLAYILVIFALNASLPHAGTAFFAGLIIATITLVAICFAKGESPGWRWGGD